MQDEVHKEAQEKQTKSRLWRLIRLDPGRIQPKPSTYTEKKRNKQLHPNLHQSFHLSTATKTMAKETLTTQFQ